MIQRIQSVYLFLAAVCAVLLCCYAPLFFMTEEGLANPTMYSMDFRHIHEMMYDGANNLVHVPDGAVMDIWGLSVIAALLGVLCLGNIFLFRKRILQARINVVIVFLAIGYYAMLAMYAWFMTKRYQVDWSIEWSAGLPLIIIILVAMATRKILADEALVRAADRIR